MTFSDGTSFDAAAVKANFDWVKDVENTATAASFPVYYGHTEVVDPTTVKIVLRQADSNLLESLSSMKLGFLSPKSLVKNVDLCSGGPAIVGTEPFVFESYCCGQSVTFARATHVDRDEEQRERRRRQDQMAQPISEPRQPSEPCTNRFFPTIG